MIRLMKPDEIHFAAFCTDQVGWGGETLEDFNMFYEHNAQGCLVAEEDGSPVGICVASPYGFHGFVGELIVLAANRGQGLGRALLDRAVLYLVERGIFEVYLDGVLAAVPIYERAGFRKVCHSLRFKGKIAGRMPREVRMMTLADLPAVIALDREIFGDDRAFFLKQRLILHPHLSLVYERSGVIQGFLMGKQRKEAVTIGPWVQRSGVPETALLEGAASQAGTGDLSLGVLECNHKAVRTMLELGFNCRTDSPWRMVYCHANPGILRAGQGILGTHPSAWAIGSPAKG